MTDSVCFSSHWCVCVCVCVCVCAGWFRLRLQGSVHFGMFRMPVANQRNASGQKATSQRVGDLAVVCFLFGACWV